MLLEWPPRVRMPSWWVNMWLWLQTLPVPYSSYATP
jgi:hypothetical protein